jgi:hypothetical protein
MGMLGVVFDGSSEIIDELLTEVVRFKHPGSRYWRVNTELNGVRLNMDDASPGQIERLIDLAEQMIADRKDDLVEMVELLTTSGSGKGGSKGPEAKKAATQGTGNRSGGAPPRRSKG